MAIIFLDLPVKEVPGGPKLNMVTVCLAAAVAAGGITGAKSRVRMPDAMDVAAIGLHVA